MKDHNNRPQEQTPSATGLVVGATSPQTAQQIPGVPFAQRNTPRKTTGAPLRGAGRDEAAGVHIRLPDAPTARALTGRGPIPAQPRRRPARSRGGGEPLPARAGRGGAAAPEAPECEAPVAQGEEDAGEVEVEEREEGGLARTAMETGE